MERKIPTPEEVKAQASKPESTKCPACGRKWALTHQVTCGISAAFVYGGHEWVPTKG